MVSNSDSKKNFNIEMVSIEVVLSFTYISQNVGKSMADFTGQPCDDFQLAVCPTKQDGAISK